MSLKLIGSHNDVTIPVLALRPPISRADIPALRDRFLALLDDCQAAVVIIDLSAFGAPDLAVVDALARLTLAARRRGCEIRIVGAGQRLAGLLSLLGLLAAVGSGLQSHWQVEQREEAIDIEEVVDPDDLPG